MANRDWRADEQENESENDSANSNPADSNSENSDPADSNSENSNPTDSNSANSNPADSNSMDSNLVDFNSTDFSDLSGSSSSPVIGHGYLKPSPDEKILIHVLDFKKMYACWLPGLRYTLYFDKEPKTPALKRVREIVLLEVYDGTGKKIIELTDEEFNQFEMTYDLFSTYGGEIWFYREKSGRRQKNQFYLKQKPSKSEEPIRKYHLSDIV
ncbi:hypothetical protein [Methanolapillus ohkumae]|uniref:Uncharacterized protein n=1 Tax=Methanolapillus ohkumae TaxID=3028298 RepID=A0AA96V804_9EURY|nr:hypothetical protein MsAm2_13050 [Methanosarcinaceae archaeon Am2]